MTDKEKANDPISRPEKTEGGKPLDIYSEKAEVKAIRFDENQIRAAALAYARYLNEHDLTPGDATFLEPEELGIELKPAAGDETGSESARTGTEDQPEAKDPRGPMVYSWDRPGAHSEAIGAELVRKAEEENRKNNKKQKKNKYAARAARAAKKEAKAEAKAGRKASEPAGGRRRIKGSGLAAITELHDYIQDGIDEKFSSLGRNFARGMHSIASTYRSSRRSIGIALLVIGVLASAILMIFDRFTVYEYAYNGKILGYVQEQEEVTDVLEVAGKKLSQNSSGSNGVEFVANQNVTFNLVDGRGKSADSADIAINKLIFMTDIETEAYGVYDGSKLVAIVKDNADAEKLLSHTMEELSTPDSGMELVSAEFTNELSVKPVNVLLGSVQSNAAAQRQMVKGGNMETYHIVEEGETAESLAELFGVETIDIFNEDNSEVAENIEQGDKVCIHSVVEPVSVKMIETGKLKEIIEYETIKKETDEYYKGDTYLEQEGENGVQIFEGTLTKVGGEVTDRDEISTEVIRKVRNKIILVGTAERPKTAPTGTFMMPIETYVVTSEFGGRWGRNHDGMDFGASTGTPIYASDGGEVIRAQYYSGYGLCVDIDHGNGVFTRYGHCSKLLVSAGDLVYQGQMIALVGNTGHSFGSHLHFEVRVDGTPQNPRNYVNP